MMRLHAPPISGVRYLQSFNQYKMAKRGGSVAKLASILRMYIPAGKATPSPPLGPALGQVRDLERIYLCANDMTIPFQGS
jgi:hypothetical protein